MSGEKPTSRDRILFAIAANQRDELIETIVKLLTLAGYPTPEELKRLVDGEE